MAKTIKKVTPKTKVSTKEGPVWNLKILYKSVDDPQIEKDVQEYETERLVFAQKFDTDKKGYLENEDALLEALQAWEIMLRPKAFLYYLFSLQDIEADNLKARSKSTLIEGRVTKANNNTDFFHISLGKISKSKQTEFLASPKLSYYKTFLDRVFSDAQFQLSLPEEKVMSLKSLPAYDMWVDGNEKILNMQTVEWRGKRIPISEATRLVLTLKISSERKRLADKINIALASVASFSEAEINAVYTNKKINDELRGYKTAYEQTVRGYRNDPEVVMNLIKTVSENYNLCHRFFRIKAKLLKQKKFGYYDRAASVGQVGATYSFATATDTLKKVFGGIDTKYADILSDYIKNGQIDAPPRIGKTGGAYCKSAFGLPTLILLNHGEGLRSLATYGHEMGHAFHSHLSQSQGSFYCRYSTSLAETASTLFESITIDSVLSSLSKKEQIVALHDKIEKSVQTIFRQVACFNFELDLHTAVRTKGYVSKEEICDLHNKNMKAYLGPLFEVRQEDGYMFAQWSHIRRFFYVYSYAYGMLVSQAMLNKYRQDPSFWSSIEKFLSAGGSDSPENILKSIGIDVTKPEFWEQGIKEIEADIIKLEKLTK